MSQKLFTLGPVEMFEYTRARSLGQLPYFRTEDFSTINLECSEKLKRIAGAPEDAHVFLLTCSGTGAMEAVVGGCFSGAPGSEDRLLVIDGGGFGHRFCEIAAHHGIPHESVKLEFGQALEKEMLGGLLRGFAARNDAIRHCEEQGDEAVDSRNDAIRHCEEQGDEAVDSRNNASFTGLLVNLHESTTGQLFDKDMLAGLCRGHGLYFVVDAISSFLADPLDFEKDGVDALIISSQKALALPPGLSAVILSDRLYKKILEQEIKPFSMYFDFQDAEANAVRGQTPFTPAIGLILALLERLAHIESEGGAEASIKRTKAIAEDFRERIGPLLKEGKIAIPSYPLSNACTPLVFPNGGAKKVYETLALKKGIWLNPNGGELADKVLRVGHLGDITKEDNEMLTALLTGILV